MTTTPATDRTRELLARARAAEDERDEAKRQRDALQRKLDRREPSENDRAANALLTRQLQAELAAAREELGMLTRQLKRTALVEPDPEIARLREANALLTRANPQIGPLREQVAQLQRELQTARKTMAALSAAEDPETVRLRAANEALTEQVRVLQQCNATLANQERSA